MFACRRADGDGAKLTLTLTILRRPSQISHFVDGGLTL